MAAGINVSAREKTVLIKALITHGCVRVFLFLPSQHVCIWRLHRMAIRGDASTFGLQLPLVYLLNS